MDIRGLRDMQPENRSLLRGGGTNAPAKPPREEGFIETLK